jgi:hypothetical protein
MYYFQVGAPLSSRMHPIYKFEPQSGVFHRHTYALPFLFSPKKLGTCE